MRIAITLRADEGSLTLPLHYNEIVQGFIYNNLDETLAAWLHDEAYLYNNRRYKMFTFSRLFGKYKISNGTITYFGPVSLKMASNNDEVLSSFASMLLKKRSVRIGRQYCSIESVSILPQPVVRKKRTIVKALSPITAHSTLLTAEGKKKTYFYSPKENDFSEFLIANLLRKWKSLNHNSSFLEEELQDAWVRPYKVNARDQKIIKVKSTYVKGWTGYFEVNLPEELFQLALDTGLGARNAQGFGMVDPVLS